MLHIGVKKMPHGFDHLQKLPASCWNNHNKFSWVPLLRGDIRSFRRHFKNHENRREFGGGSLWGGAGNRSPQGCCELLRRDLLWTAKGSNGVDFAFPITIFLKIWNKNVKPHNNVFFTRGFIPLFLLPVNHNFFGNESITTSPEGTLATIKKRQKLFWRLWCKVIMVVFFCRPSPWGGRSGQRPVNHSKKLPCTHSPRPPMSQFATHAAGFWQCGAMLKLVLNLPKNRPNWELQQNFSQLILAKIPNS